MVRSLAKARLLLCHNKCTIMCNNRSSAACHLHVPGLLSLTVTPPSLTCPAHSSRLISFPSAAVSRSKKGLVRRGGKQGLGPAKTPPHRWSLPTPFDDIACIFSSLYKKKNRSLKKLNTWPCFFKPTNAKDTLQSRVNFVAIFCHYFALLCDLHRLQQCRQKC